MKDSQEHKNEQLDRLLASVPAPKAPEWFEARTLARLRREGKASMMERVQAALFSRSGVAAAFAACMLVVLGLSVLQPHKNEGTQVANGVKGQVEGLEGEKFDDALEAFVSYSQEVQQWDQDFFR